MPSTRAGAPGTDPFEQARHAARELLRRTGDDHYDALVVLGTGLAPVAQLLGGEDPSVDLTGLPWFPRFTGVGHQSSAWAVTIGGTRVLVMAGRLHLYEGCTPAETVHPIRTAIAAGCHTVLLTCSAGAVHAGLSVGQLVAVRDHLNMTGTSPLTAMPPGHPAGSPFVDLVDMWSPSLRATASSVDPSIVEGVYAQMPGPQFETPAEIAMLRTLGADLVGMSTVPEALAARHLGAQLLGVAIVTNLAAGVAPGAVPIDHVTTEAGAASERVAALVRGVLAALTPPTGDHGA